MIPVEQRELTDIERDIVGDCWKACIASILEVPLEAVPHFFQREQDGETQSGWNETLHFLRDYKLTLTTFGLWGNDAPYLKFGNAEIRYHFSAPGHWIASVRSPRVIVKSGMYGSHAVVMRASEIVWDPHPQREMGHLGFEQGYLLTRT